MSKKYKIKKRKKLVNVYHIFILFAILLITMSYSYALLSDKLEIKGKANILSINDDNEYGNSTYYWSIPHKWGGNDAYTYNLVLSITNLDEDYDYWEVSFDVPDGFLIESSNIWQASSISLSGNRVTLICQSWNNIVSKGSKLDFDCQITFSSEVNVTINNLTLNGKYAKYVNPSTPDTDTNTITNETTNSITNTTTNETTNSTTNTITNETTNSTTNTTTNEIDPPIIEPSGTTTYTWAQTGFWGVPGNYIYQIVIPIDYFGETITSWKISFDVPDGFSVENSAIYQAGSVSLSGNTITITSNDWSGYIEENTGIEFTMQLSFETEVEFNISNFKFNDINISYGT